MSTLGIGVPLPIFREGGKQFHSTKTFITLVSGMLRRQRLVLVAIFEYPSHQ